MLATVLGRGRMAAPPNESCLVCSYNIVLHDSLYLARESKLRQLGQEDDVSAGQTLLSEFVDDQACTKQLEPGRLSVAARS